MFFSDNEEFKKYGYFDVNGVKTFSKYEAWQTAQQQGIATDDIKFIFSDDKLSSIDWTVEPTASLQELYAQRAQQIRDKYDYVVLMYSGGIDSHVILNTFVQNNIKLDEVVTIGNREYQPETAKINQEVFGKAIPYIDLLNLGKLGTKFNYVDIGQLIVDQFSDPYHFDNFMYYYNGPLSPWYLAFRSQLFKLKNEGHVAEAESGKKVCYIWGYDKPNIFEVDGNWCFKYTDSVSDFSVRPYNNKERLGGVLGNFYDEPFFVSPDLPELTIKQCHLVVQMLKTITSAKDPRLCPVEDVANTGPFIEHPVGKGTISGTWLKKKELERIIYPDEDVDSFGDDKVRGSVMFTARDRWFFQSTFENRNRLIKKYKKMLREEAGYFKYNIEGVALNSISLYGKPYIIDKS